MPRSWVDYCVCVGTGKRVLVHGAAEVRYRFRGWLRKLRAVQKAAACACDLADDADEDEVPGDAGDEPPPQTWAKCYPCGRYVPVPDDVDAAALARRWTCADAPWAEGACLAPGAPAPALPTPPLSPVSPEVRAPPALALLADAVAVVES